jgi:hypothetical protein
MKCFLDHMQGKRDRQDCVLGSDCATQGSMTLLVGQLQHQGKKSTVLQD